MAQESSESDHGQQTPVVIVKQNISASITSVALGILATVIALASAYYAKEATETARESTRIQQVSIRPILKLSLLAAEYNRNNIKVVMLLSNLGSTTAILTELSMPRSASTDNDYILKTARVISPGASRRENVIIPRMHNGVDVLGYLQEKDLTIRLEYLSEEYPKELYEAGLVFSDFKWHDRSIIGISRN